MDQKMNEKLPSESLSSISIGDDDKKKLKLTNVKAQII